LKKRATDLPLPSCEGPLLANACAGRGLPRRSSAQFAQYTRVDFEKKPIALRSLLDFGLLVGLKKR
jgi:hypothetical protein